VEVTKKDDVCNFVLNDDHIRKLVKLYKEKMPEFLTVSDDLYRELKW
jgi:hypothetical protein